MNASQVTNAMLISHFSVTIAPGDFKAIDSKGRSLMLTDLRLKYSKLAKTKKAAKVYSQVTAEVATANITDVYAEISQHYASDNRANVMIRETQPGVDFAQLEIKAYFRVSATDKHTLHLNCTDFSGKDLTDLFGDYKLFKGQKQGVTIGGLTCTEAFEVIDRLVQIIEKF